MDLTKATSKALVVRWKPTAPWRIGDDTGSRESSGGILHSDTLYAAVCSAMNAMGWLPQWLDATAKTATPAVVFTSAFPWQSDQYYFPAPAPLWPPRGAGRRVRSATLLPASVIRALLEGVAIEEAKYVPDAASGCLLLADRASRGGPFRHAVRSKVAVDRLSGVTGSVQKLGALEFAEHSGLWNAACFSGDEARSEWRAKLVTCFRYLADAGMGGNRSCGWGRSATPAVDDRHVESLLWPGPLEIEGAKAWWNLSLLYPGVGDAIDWTRGGYKLIERGGRIESLEQWGAQKRRAPMVAEGSVLVAENQPVGSAPDTAPEGFAHPVYKNGFAVSIAVPWRANA